MLRRALARARSYSFGSTKGVLGISKPMLDKKVDKALAGMPDPNAPVNDPPLTLKSMFYPFDERFEDCGTGATYWKNMAKDWAAGLVVAMVAIPLAMGFAIASGLTYTSMLIF